MHRNHHLPAVLAVVTAIVLGFGAPAPAKDGAGYPWSPSARDAKVLDRMEKQTLNLNFPNTPFAQVLAFLGDILGCKVTASPSIDAGAITVSCRLSGATLRDALDALAFAAGDLAWTVEDGNIRFEESGESEPAAAVETAVLIGTARRQAAVGGPARVTADKMATQKVSLSFEETPLSQCLDFLRDVTNLSLVVASDVDTDEVAVTVRLKDIPLQNALKLMLASGDLDYEVRGGFVAIDRSERMYDAPPSPILQQDIKVPVKPQRLRDLMAYLAKSTDTRAVLDVAAWNHEAELPLSSSRPVPLEEVLGLIRAASGFEATVVRDRSGADVLVAFGTPK